MTEITKLESLQMTVDNLTYDLAVLDGSHRALQSKYDELGTSIYAFSKVLHEMNTLTTSLEASVDVLSRAVERLETKPVEVATGFKYTANDIATEHLRLTNSTTSVFRVRALIGDIVRKNNLNVPEFSTSLMTTHVDTGEARLYNAAAKTVILQTLTQLDTGLVPLATPELGLTKPGRRLLEYLQAHSAVNGKTWTELSSLIGIPRTSLRDALTDLVSCGLVTYTNTTSPPYISITMVS